MVETLREKQTRFMRMTGLLFQYIDLQPGWSATYGEAYRVKARADTHPNSNHHRRLAIDINLFIDGAYQSSSDAHQPLGAFWELLATDAVWGGHFGDGNHYSLLFEGQK